MDKVEKYGMTLKMEARVATMAYNAVAYSSSSSINVLVEPPGKEGVEE